MEPENPDYAFYEANSYGMYDQATYTEKMNAVTRDFAGDGTAAKALYWLADKETDTLKKIAYYRELSERYPIGEFSFARSGMSDYFDVLVDSDLEAAEALAKGIWEQHADSAWLPRLRGAQKLLRSEGLLKSGRTDEAIDSLSVAVASSISAISRRAVLLKADAFASQGEQRRSMDVLKMFFLANPDIVVYEKTESLGVSVGMDRQQVKDFIKSALLKEAPAATDLRGTSYIDHQPIKLSDFRGKTILLTFWFPTCGPCHAEFPHFEAVLQKMKGQHEIAYIGVNIVHDQDDYVMPFIKKGSTSFIPMKDSPDERGNLIAEAAPTNYLID